MNYETSLAFPVTSFLSAQQQNNISQVFTVEEVRPLSSLCQVMESMGSVAQVMNNDSKYGQLFVGVFSYSPSLIFEEIICNSASCPGFYCTSNSTKATACGPGTYMMPDNVGKL